MIVRKEIEFAGRRLVLEAGKLAGQANMAVQVTYGDSVVLTTAVSGGLNKDLDYFPLSVNYEERLYAGGLIKSSRFIKREGRATDEAVIIRRLIDHAIRPLFPEGFKDEVQVVNTVLSLDPSADPRFLSMIGTSASLHASDIPWEGPMVTALVGYINDEYVLNPSREQLEESDLDLVISFVGDDLRYLAMEASANLLPEETILGAIEFARNRLDPVLELVEEFARELNPEGSKYEYESQTLPEELLEDVRSVIEPRVEDLLYRNITKKHDFNALREEILEEVYSKFEGKYKKADMARSFEEIEKEVLQRNIVLNERRPDGRGIKEVRPISCEVSLLPRTHGSALFNRGVTQVLTVATLGSPNMEMIIQDMYGEDTKRYMHFYNFPPFSVGEVGRIGRAGGREIGHGMLAEKALVPVIPSQSEFPYTILLVSETLSSSGSSSMASACGSTLALMDAGVPIKDMVGGVGVGLMATDDFSEYKIITDLAYREDAFGLLDFKMTGTRTGVTAIQSDMKAKGIPMELLPKIFEQSKEGRIHVLDEMQKVMSAPRGTVSKYAPKSASIKIAPEKIGMIIGSGGKTIKKLQESSNTVLNIEEDGTVTATGSSDEDLKDVLGRISAMTKDVEVGEVYDGVVEDIVDFGAFVEILPGKSGLLHVSEISHDYVSDVKEHLKVGDHVRVKVIDVDRGKISLSMKALTPRPEGDSPRRQPRTNGRSRARRDRPRRR